MALCEEMRQRHPEQLAVLREPFPYLRHTVDGGNERNLTWVPVFTEHEGHFAASFLRVLIDRADRSPDGVRLTITESGFDAVPLERRAEAFKANEGGWEHQSKT